MEPDELENKLTAWWLDIAPARQQDLLTVPLPPSPWLVESIAAAGLGASDVDHFLTAKRSHPDSVRDAGLNPRPN